MAWFENVREDWVTYERDICRQGLWTLLVYRFGRWRYGIGPRWLRLPFSFFYRFLKVVSQILTGIDIPCETQIGRRFLIEHFGGIIVSGDAVIGDDVTIRNGVTIGLRRVGERGAPRIGNRVDIGAGAKILGKITVGDNAVIGANAVVLRDVPPGHLAVGIPATIRPPKGGHRPTSPVEGGPDLSFFGPVLILTVLLGAAAVLPLRAQDATLTESKEFYAAQKQRKLTPAEMLRDFEAATTDTYEFGEGDEITIEVYGRPELSGRQVIGPDGKVTLPLIGSVHLAGLSRDSAREGLSSRLSEYYENVSVNVRVEKYTSNRVFILGRVSRPGALEFETAPTLIEALTKAGSLPVGGAGADKAALNRCAVFRGRDAAVWVDLKSLLAEGNLAYNLRLKRNDVVYIPDSDDQLVYVLGEVLHPGAFRLTPGMTLMDAFAQAGGATHDGVEDKIQIIRMSSDLQRQFSLGELLASGSSMNFSLHEGDVIYVPRRALAKFGYVVEKVNPIVSSILFGGLAAK